ncbi:MAG: hypothetical protein ACRDXB_02505 [Actinomycetes bacterium]
MAPVATGEVDVQLGDPRTVWTFAIGAFGLVVAQILAGYKLSALAHATTGHLDIGQVARSRRRSEWSIAFSVYPIILGLRFLLSGSDRPLLHTTFLMLVLAHLLSEYAFVGWVHVRLNRSTEYNGTSTPYRLLPPSIGRRIYNVQAIAVCGHALSATLALILLAGTIDSVRNRAPDLPPETFVEIIAAAAVVAIPLFLIRPTHLMSAAITGDALYLPAVVRAAESFIRVGAITAPLAALVIASAPMAPAAPTTALVRAILIGYALIWSGLQFGWLMGFRIGTFPKHWLRGRRAP